MSTDKPKMQDQNIVAKALAQLSRLVPVLLCATIPILLGLVVLVIVYLTAEIPLRQFFIDPVSEFNAPMYIGLVSNFGVVCWCVASAVCLFGGWLVFRQTTNRETGLFLICAGLVSGLLMFDDLYLLHEELLPDHLFIPQKLVFVAYGGIVLGFLVRFRQAILDSDFMLLVIAFGFLGASAFVDLFVLPEEFFIFDGFPGRHIIEDGLKVMGIVMWSVYFVRTCFQRVAPLLQPGETN